MYNFARSYYLDCLLLHVHVKCPKMLAIDEWPSSLLKVIGITAKVIGIGAIPYGHILFRLLFHCNYISVLYIVSNILSVISWSLKNYLTTNTSLLRCYITLAVAFVIINLHTKLEMPSLDRTSTWIDGRTDGRTDRATACTVHRASIASRGKNESRDLDHVQSGYFVIHRLTWYGQPMCTSTFARSIDTIKPKKK